MKQPHTFSDWFLSFFPPRTRKLVLVLAAVTVFLMVVTIWYYSVLKLRSALFWNMLLAMLPLLFSLVVFRQARRGRPKWLVAVLCAAWLFFFPNAPYMLTDLIHLALYSHFKMGRPNDEILPWLGMFQIEMCVIVGCLCGLLSLLLLHTLVAGRFGKVWGWAFAAAVSALSGLAIYIGRFPRLNSWDVAVRPLFIIKSLQGMFGARMVKLSIIFAALTFLAYVIFYACFNSAGDEL